MTIEVNASPIPEQLWVALRQILPPLVLFAVGRGWIAEDLATMLCAVAAVLVPIVYGQIKTWRRSASLIALANAVPDSVATVK